VKGQVFIHGIQVHGFWVPGKGAIHSVPISMDSGPGIARFFRYPH